MWKKKYQNKVFWKCAHCTYISHFGQMRLFMNCIGGEGCVNLYHACIYSLHCIFVILLLSLFIYMNYITPQGTEGLFTDFHCWFLVKILSHTFAFKHGKYPEQLERSWPAQCGFQHNICSVFGRFQITIIDKWFKWLLIILHDYLLSEAKCSRNRNVFYFFCYQQLKYISLLEMQFIYFKWMNL